MESLSEFYRLASTNASGGLFQPSLRTDPIPVTFAALIERDSRMAAAKLAHAPIQAAQGATAEDAGAQGGEEGVALAGENGASSEEIKKRVNPVN
mmetsp:Transcript_9317/g.29726  ORF Transcript_9317/g.29726 Transcript_9317/m.29726 type:complete len:95 (+) Transcript_9317:319-603(+)